MAVTPAGTLLVCDHNNHRLREVLGDPERTVRTLVGNGKDDATEGPALESSIKQPAAVLCAGDTVLLSSGTGRICLYDCKTSEPTARCLAF